MRSESHMVGVRGVTAIGNELLRHDLTVQHAAVDCALYTLYPLAARYTPSDRHLPGVVGANTAPSRSSFRGQQGENEE